VGGFHRAHQAVYLDDLAERRITGEWGECGVGHAGSGSADGESPHAAGLSVHRDRAQRQRRQCAGDRSMLDYAFAPADPERVLAILADPATRIVSLTITEGGSNVDDKTGVFDSHNPAVQADAERGEAPPHTAFGYVCEAIARRRKNNTPPFTVMSCDNLQGNGEIARTAFTAFARMRDPSLVDCMQTNVPFPNAMVDRITPQTTDTDREMVRATFGLSDAWPVVTEPFRQWVIEDSFAHGRPPVEEAGAQTVSEVHPYETMKLRLLNGSHQAMAYVGYLSGYRYADEVIADANLRTFIARLMDDEVTALLPAVPGIDVREYKQTLLERFGNPRIKDTLARLATDGSDRMPKFVLPSISDALAMGRPHRLLTQFSACGVSSASWVISRRGLPS
jgi:mannitol 2-dehydrogenase